MDERASRGEREFEALIGSRPEETVAAVRARSPELFETPLEVRPAAHWLGRS
jgi:hypothetical protein